MFKAMNRSKRWLLFMLLIMAGGAGLFAQSITVVFEEWPPYEFSTDGKMSGTDFEIVTEAFKRLGLTPKFASLPWVRAVKEVTDGTSAAIFSISKNPDRLKVMDFPAVPINAERKVFFTLKDSKLTITKYADLKGLNVGVVRGNSISPDFDAQTGFNKIEVDNQEALIKMLIGKRFDAAITSDLVGFDIARKLAVVDKLSVHPFIAMEALLYIAFSKANKDIPPGLAEKMSKVLSQMKSDGFIDKVLNSYKK